MRSTVLPASVFLAMATSACSDSRADTPGGDAPAARNPAAAVWKEQHVEFVYVGRTSRYSCEGLREKVRAMLLDLGARRDLTLAPAACIDFNRAPTGPAPPRLKIVFSSPALLDASAKPSRDGDLAATQARFESFTITSDTFRNMEIADCELVQEFAQQILPKLAVRNVRQDIACSADQPAGSRFLIRGEILKTLTRAEDRALRDARSSGAD